jgi:tetratricopeptide (TPR) repeat protein
MRNFILSQKMGHTHSFIIYEIMNERDRANKVSSGASRVTDRERRSGFDSSRAKSLESLVAEWTLEHKQVHVEPQYEQNEIQTECMNYSAALIRRNEGLVVDDNDLFYQASRIGLLFEHSHLFERALDYYREALLFKNKTIRNESTDIQVAFADIVFKVGIIHMQPESHSFEKSVGAFDLCLDLRRRCCGVSHSSVGSTLYWLGLLYSAVEEHEYALHLLHESLSILMCTSPGSNELKDVWLAVGKAHQAIGHTDLCPMMH